VGSPSESGCVKMNGNSKTVTAFADNDQAVFFEHGIYFTRASVKTLLKIIAERNDAKFVDIWPA